jgi:flagellar basal-body rod protein FlgC
MITGISSNLQALSALAVSQAVTADNVANVNTDGYRSARVTLETGQGGDGVAVQEISRDANPGPVRYEEIPSLTEEGRYEAAMTAVEGSNVDITTQMVNMVRDANAYSANITAIRTQEELVGSILNMTA